MATRLLHLAIEFFLIGTFSFGGGMATIPFLFNLADKYDWFTPSELVDMIAISEVTPGPIGVNMATYVGIKTAGFIGGLISILALTAPAIIVMLFAYKYILLNRSPYVDKAFYGLKPVVFALFLSGVWSVARVTLFSVENGFHFNYLECGIAIGVFLLSLFSKKLFKRSIHPTILILLGGTIGAISYFI